MRSAASAGKNGKKKETRPASLFETVEKPLRWVFLDSLVPACGPVSPNFCENLAGYGVFSRRMSVKKHPIRKSLRFRRLFRQTGKETHRASLFLLLCSGPISRVLWSAAIYLGRTLLSVSLPPVWRLAEQAVAPKSVLLRIEFTGCPGHPGHRWALTPPFHLFPAGGGVVYFCCTCPAVARGRCYRLSCSVKPGLSSRSRPRAAARAAAVSLYRRRREMSTPPLCKSRF